MENVNRQRLTVRVSKNSLSFVAVNVEDKEKPVIFEPYVVRSGISIAANLREAFRTSQLLNMGFRRVQVLIDAPTDVVPIDVFEESQVDLLYSHVFTRQDNDEVVYNVIPSLNAVALFAVNRDLRLVLTDHFDDVKFVCLDSPIWKHLHQRSFMGQRHKLFGYFHDKKLDVFSFAQNRFRFNNSFSTNNAHDALYFILYVWKQLMFQAENDELHVVGDIPDSDWLVGELRQYLQRVYVINPIADFNRSPIAKVQGMPYDLSTYLIKGR